jgi:GNAT superfamily N-acetyltransferase
MIRKGKIEDLPELLELIIELAVYEKAESEVSNTVERMKVDGFGDNPVYGFIVAEEEGKIVGASIYYFRYSTWKGKRIYLEDLIVNEDWRGKGLGKQLFEQTMAIGKESNCTGMMWQVLDWNESAINFYKKYNTEFDEEWVNCHLQF